MAGSSRSPVLRLRWAELLRRVFVVDPLTCPRCRRLMQIVAVITDPTAITRILAHRTPTRDPPAPGRRRPQAPRTR